MIRKKSKYQDKPIVDLSGPDGNAFVLLGMSRGWSKQLGLDYKEIQKEATSGDYEHLLETLDKYFGDYVIFER